MGEYLLSLLHLTAVIFMCMHSHMASLAEEIRSANERFMSLFASGDMQGLSQLYTEDCKLMPPGDDVVVGRAGTPCI